MKISCLFILLCGLLATSSAQMAQSGSSQFNSALGLELYRKLSTDSQSLDLQEPVMHAINSALDALDLLGNWDHKATVQIRNTQIHKMTINKLNSREMKVQIPVSSDLVVKFLGFPYQFQIQGNISILADVDKNTLNIKSCGFLTGSLRSALILRVSPFLLMALTSIDSPKLTAEVEAQGSLEAS